MATCWRRTRCRGARSPPAAVGPAPFRARLSPDAAGAPQLRAMAVDVRHSASLKSPELDTLSQVLRDSASGLDDAVLDDQLERFSRISVVTVDDEVQGFLFGSL